MIRITHVITRLVRGGAEQVLRSLVAHADRSRFEPSVLCGPQDPSMLEAMRRHAPVEIVPGLVREISPFRDLMVYRRLRARFKKEKPDVVHGHTYKAGVLAGVAARKAGVPAVVFTPHGHIFQPDAHIPGVPPQGQKLRFLRWVTRFAQMRVDKVTALSQEDMEEQLSHWLAPPEKYLVIRNGIDTESYSPRSEWKPSANPVIGAVGRLTAEKGHVDLVRMLQHLPDARLVIVGAGPERDGLKAEAERIGAGDRVELPGEIDAAEVLPSFDLFVQPSRYEAQGLSILEAMAAGLPVVATRVGGIPGVVRDGETGILVDPQSPEGLAEGVRGLLQDPARGRRIAAAALEEVRSRWSVAGMVRKYEKLYLELLGGE